MNRREKILLTAVGGIGSLFVVAYGAKVFFLDPLKDLSLRKAQVQTKLGLVGDERRAFFSSEDYLKGLAPLLFGPEPDEASAAAGKMLTDEILKLGLQESQFSRSPVGPRKLRGGQEIGWSVQGEGPLSKMLDLLFVLEQTPQVHRLENLVLAAGDKPGHLRARFRYLTLVVDGYGPNPKNPPKPKLTLDSPQRRVFDLISTRDLLRPYIPVPPPPPPNPVAPPAPDAGSEHLTVVSLSEWAGVSEVHVVDTTTQKLVKLKKGDPLSGGEIVMVDYRTMPVPGSSGLVSYSRVIFKIGNAYWAVEQGQTLATKHQLAAEQLPPELRGL